MNQATPNKITRNLNGNEYHFYGPNATLVQWMERSPMATEVINRARLDEETLLRALGASGALPLLL